MIDPAVDASTDFVGRGTDLPRAEVCIDRAAFRRNIETLRATLAPPTQLWAVVKANAYGHDAELLAQDAVAAGARRLCVATLSEARHLRRIGIRVPMLVLGPLDPAGVGRAVDMDVSVTVLSERMVAGLEHAATAAGRRASRKPVRVHLKVDTGMGRWGVPLAQAPHMLDRLLSLPHVDVEGVMTHLATADDPDDDGFFELQLERFEGIVEHTRTRVPHVVAHAANSAATLRSTRAHFDAVRPGVATFGLDPMQDDPAAHGLEPVLSMRSHVADVRLLQPGESTGYCRTWVADSPSRVAEVPLGYADGVRRSLANQGSVLIGGVECGIVGNVSMDHVSVLVDASVQPGDVVTILGRDGDAEVRAEHHARWADTINYEITCGIALEPRVLRTHENAT